MEQQSNKPIISIGVLFFIFGFITWVCSVLIPYLQLACELNNFQAQLVSFAFYISYFVMALPGGWILKYTGFKKGISLGLFIMMCGSLLFIPGALYRTYPFFLAGLFVQGAGLAILQTAANPYVTVLGPAESAARRMSIMGICNGFAGILAPYILGKIVLDDADAVKTQVEALGTMEKEAALNALASKVMLPYGIIAAALLLLSIWFYKISLPEPEEEKAEENAASAQPDRKSVLQYPQLLLGVVTLFLYVGVEVIAGNTIISYGAWTGIALNTAKFFSSFTLFCMLIGYIIGIICIPRYCSQVQALTVSAVLGIIFSLAAIHTTGVVSVVFIALLGLANSLMWPSIWPLAITGLGRHTKTGSALLIMAIAGGALVPLLYGRLSDVFDPKLAYWIVVPCYIAIGLYALFSRARLKKIKSIAGQTGADHKEVSVALKPE
ncbi:sugar MFS transporter [Niabella beijingensis]|uniref:sugar MFS transporter n=1 Tax=Niabella beijingensis TaxID=2872700 RepID=UPI001CBDDEE6|nr:sugar MFS transporter [Niabella beijingensis]MBZ4188866.1 sugar MFS transporter [Niabella beijingensis]